MKKKLLGLLLVTALALTGCGGASATDADGTLVRISQRIRTPSENLDDTGYC